MWNKGPLAVLIDLRDGPHQSYPPAESAQAGQSVKARPSIARAQLSHTRAWRIANLVTTVLGLCALAYGCGGSSTSPTPVVDPDLSPAGFFSVHGVGVTVAPGMRATADQLWLEVRGCIAADGHGDPSDPRALPVDVVPGLLTDCGGGASTQVIGCSFAAGSIASFRIKVDAQFYSRALRHELTNFAYFELGRKGDASPEYGGHDLLFERCAGDGVPL